MLFVAEYLTGRFVSDSDQHSANAGYRPQHLYPASELRSADLVSIT